MAAPPRAGPPPLWSDLPEEILGLEILVRLPAGDHVRCRGVCRAWRRTASAHDNIMTHHRHQPSLALVLLAKRDGATGGDLRAFDHRDLRAFDRRAAAEARLQPVARVSDFSAITVEASCDGLLVLSVCTLYPSRRRHIICVNPTTRQMGRVREMQGYKASGLYWHDPTNEYRLLLQLRSTAYDASATDTCYVLALGGDERLPRRIEFPPELSPGFLCAPVAVRGNLHWSRRPYPVEDQTQSGEKITVFDTTAETFRLLCSPTILQTSSSRAFRLYEVDGALGLYSCDDSMMAVDIWAMRDYDSEVWSHEYHVALPMASVRANQSLNVMVVHDERRGVFVLRSFGEVLAFVDSEGKLLWFSRHGHAHIFFPDTHRIKESLVRHSFFSALEGASDFEYIFSRLRRRV